MTNSPIKHHAEQITLRSLFLVCMLFSAVYGSAAYAQSATHAENRVDQEAQISQAELEQVLAPIALYPDSILSHILVASTYPLELVQAERWLSDHEELDGQDAVDAAEDKDWDPSVKALLAFPRIIERMSQDLDWTQKLGNAFLQDEEFVLNSVQNLRELAQEAGSLDKMDKVTVTRDRESIIIEPRERTVVYVPYYDTRVVYGHWPWRHYQPIYWDYPYVSAGYYDDYYAHYPHRRFFWGPRISLSFGFFSHGFHWRNHHIVRISPWHYRPHRYYGHHDILRHRYAERWVHNGSRRLGHRNSRNDRIVRNHNAAAVQTIQRERSREDYRQSRIRDQLRGQRNTGVRTEPSRRVVTSQNRVRTYQPTGPGSRVALPPRSREVQPSQRVANRPATRPVNRQATVSTNSQAPRARSAPPSPQIVTPRSQPSASSRAAPSKPRASVNKPAPAKAQSSNRAPRRQPR